MVEDGVDTSDQADDPMDHDGKSDDLNREGKNTDKGQPQVQQGPSASRDLRPKDSRAGGAPGMQQHVSRPLLQDQLAVESNLGHLLTRTIEQDAGDAVTVEDVHAENLAQEENIPPHLAGYNEDMEEATQEDISVVESGADEERVQQEVPAQVMADMAAIPDAVQVLTPRSSKRWALTLDEHSEEPAERLKALQNEDTVDSHPVNSDFTVVASNLSSIGFILGKDSASVAQAARSLC
jgi:hypothetical protein